MSKMVFCCKLQKEAEGLQSPPFPGAMGIRIFEQASKQAWQMWLANQTMLINEYRLSLTDNKAREFLLNEMEQFFFGEGSNAPSGFTPKTP